jgi:C-terminal processing protease CtpA/Prc
MSFRTSRWLVVAALIAVASAQAEEPKKCNASARECELQIRQMLSGRRYLGINVVEITPPSGVFIRAVLQDGPASHADLRANDRIMSVNGRPLGDGGIKEFKRLLADAKETGTLFMIIERRGNYRKVEVRLEPYTKAQVDKIVAAHLAQSHAIPSGPQAGSQP